MNQNKQKAAEPQIVASEQSVWFMTGVFVSCVIVTPVLGFLPILTFAAALFGLNFGIKFLEKRIVRR
jgi:hypothetical protein